MTDVPAGPLTPDDLNRIERQLGAAQYNWDALPTVASVKDLVLEDMPALLAHCRYLMPLLDALALGELEQYQLGMEMGKRIGRLEGLNEALQIVRDYSPGEEGLSPAEFSWKYGTCDLEFAILKRKEQQP